MRVFVTGASGFIGAAVVRDLIDAGHQVVGLVRSETSARAVRALGAEVLHGSIEDLEALRRGAAAADGVIHTAFFHAFSQASLRTRLAVMLGGGPGGMVQRFMLAAVEADRRAIQTLGTALVGADRALISAFPTMGLTPGQLATEQALADPAAPGGLRGRSETALLALAARGVRACEVRLPPVVHDAHKQGAASMLISVAQKKRVSVYPGEGLNRWGGVQLADAARLFRLALEKGKAAERYHAVAEQGVPMRQIAEAISTRLGVPVISKTIAEASKHFGWFSPFVLTDNPVSSQLTQQRLGWQAPQSSLLLDVAGTR